MRYCPDCRAEYAPGADRCHDCEVDLVDLLVDGTELPPEPLVTVAAFDTPVKASILASRLEAEGIECFLADAETIAVHGLLAGAVGGVKVQVRGSDATKAQAISSRVALEPASRACPQCGSLEARRQGLSLPATLLLVLSLGILSLLFPVVWVCTRCGHRWK
ncbi:MAG TPA: DUF2007 domain-containing protein [Planctomycetota bacterium]|jgi:hypothetical protein|nr:DUF2007 domain-containing protein [Planctomycetota bacterium]